MLQSRQMTSWDILVATLPQWQRKQWFHATPHTWDFSQQNFTQPHIFFCMKQMQKLETLQWKETEIKSTKNMTWVKKNLKDLSVFSLKMVTANGTEKSTYIRSHNKGGKWSTLPPHHSISSNGIQDPAWIGRNKSTQCQSGDWNR